MPRRAACSPGIAHGYGVHSRYVIWARWDVDSPEGVRILHRTVAATPQKRSIFRLVVSHCQGREEMTGSGAKHKGKCRYCRLSTGRGVCWHRVDN